MNTDADNSKMLGKYAPAFFLFWARDKSAAGGQGG